MASDPFKVFREGSSQQQENIRLIWPELYDALFVPVGSGPAREFPCPICSIRYPNETAPPIVGRLTYNGHPACRGCIEQHADRPGGWPLARQDGPKPT